MYLSQKIFCFNSLTLVDVTNSLSRSFDNKTANRCCATAQNSEEINFLEIPLAIVSTLVWFYSASSLVVQM
jgi:hypothetical protein